MAEIRVVDADVVEQTLAPIIDEALELAAKIAVAVVDGPSRACAVDLGVRVKTASERIKAERAEIYEPMLKSMELLRAKYDDRIKRAAAILKLLSSGVSQFDNEERRKEDIEREKAAAEARRIREDAERKRKEAEAAEVRATEAKAAEVRRQKEAVDAEARRVQAEKDEQARKDRERREAEQAELDSKRAEEEKARIAHAEQAEASGNGEARIDNVLTSVTPIAPVMASPNLNLDRKALAEQQLLADKASTEKAEKERVEADASAKLQQEAEAESRRLRDEADAASASAAAAESAAVSVITTRPDDRTRKNTTWKWSIRDKDAALKLLKAIVEGRAPIEYSGFNPESPEKFRPSAIGKDVIKDKESFKCDGIDTWPEQTTNFLAEKEG